MNKKGLIKSIEGLGEYEPFVDEPISKKSVLSIINQIDEPKKVTVPKVAIDYYEKYKNQLLGFDEWFSDFYDSGFLEEFPDGEKLAEWLHGNTNEVNRQRELALANLIVNGPSAVDIEQEKLYTVEIPDPHNDIWEYTTLKRTGDWYVRVRMTDDSDWRAQKEHQLTEDEIRKDFDWAWRWAKEVTDEQN